MVHETPSPCRFRCVGVAFAVVAEWSPANKLPCVVAFVGGLSTADAALHLFMLLTHLPLASCAATPAPSNVKFATVHALPPCAARAASTAASSASARSRSLPMPSITLQCRPRRNSRYRAASFASSLSGESRSLGYAHWPEPKLGATGTALESRSLGYAHWPELAVTPAISMRQSRSLGYAHWPERWRANCARWV